VTLKSEYEREVEGRLIPQEEIDLRDLVRWLAIPYGDNSPQFATADWNGEPLEDGKRLQAVYESVMGKPKEPAPHTAWTKCPTCSMWQTIPVAP